MRGFFKKGSWQTFFKLTHLSNTLKYSLPYHWIPTPVEAIQYPNLLPKEPFPLVTIQILGRPLYVTLQSK